MAVFGIGTAAGARRPLGPVNRLPSKLSDRTVIVPP
jgi:hypothetical protein